MLRDYFVLLFFATVVVGGAFGVFYGVDAYMAEQRLTRENPQSRVTPSNQDNVGADPPAHTTIAPPPSPASVFGPTLAPTTTMTATPSMSTTLASVLVEPRQAVLEPGQSVAFTATALDARGEVITGVQPTQFIWQATGGSGTIDSSGVFTAGTRAGTYRDAVLVAVQYEGIAATYGVAVLVTPGPLANLVLTPQSLTTEVRGQHQFQVRGTDAYGNEIPNMNLTWQVLKPESGAMGSASGLFSGGTRAGMYENAVRVVGEYKGASREARATVKVEPGPVQQATLSAPTSTIFTGDALPFVVAAFDAYSNTITNPKVTWSADLGQVDSLGGFIAGRQAGTAQVSATISDGKSTVQTSRSFDIRMGYCGTTRQTNVWKLDWYAMDNDRSRGPSLGSSQATGNLDFDWRKGDVFGGRRNWVMLIARTRIVAQREGPVLFQVRKDDGAQLFLDGRLIMGNSNYRVPLSKSVMLAPGIYNIELHYQETVGRASLTFKTDQDVLQWIESTRCFGGYTQSPATRYFVHQASGQTLGEVANQFGVSSGEASALNKAAGSPLILPGSRSGTGRTKVILILGIDSSGGCSENDATLKQRHRMVRAIQTLGPSANGTVSQVDDSDVISFSYSGRYMDCATGRQYTSSSFPGPTAAPDLNRSPLIGITPVPVYSPSDTCGGVKNASRDLEALVSQILRLEPDATVVIIGHSLGGMVAAYYVSQQSSSFIHDKIQAVVTLDSPLAGYDWTSLTSVCSKVSPTWQDIGGFTNVVPGLANFRDQSVLQKFWSINSTSIGGSLPGSNPLWVDCGAESAFIGAFLGVLIGAFTGGFGTALIGLGAGVGIGDEAFGGHSCAFSDETALQTISSIVN